MSGSKENRQKTLDISFSTCVPVNKHKKTAQSCFKYLCVKCIFDSNPIMH